LGGLTFCTVQPKPNASAAPIASKENFFIPIRL
jgi:hypothetical protein